MISLALQGGGAHGAFTWGALDRLLEEEEFEIDGISATSSGAMNALAVAQGWLEGGREGARAKLTRLWESIAAQSGMLRWAFHNPVGASTETLLLGLSRYFTPGQINPLGLNPLRAIAESLFDFEQLRNSPPFKLFLAATRVRDGKLELFDNDRIDIDALLASTCLPQLFAPVVIEGETYWDGGYAGNPVIEPLIYRCESSDVVCILIQPLTLARLPASAREIAERTVELGFSTTFLRELATLQQAQRALAGSFPLSWLGRRLKGMRTHLIEPGESLDAYSSKSRMSTRIDFLRELYGFGRERAELWLAAHR